MDYAFLLRDYAGRPKYRDAADAMNAAANEIDRLTEDLQKRDMCAYMGPMRDCPTHGEGTEIKALQSLCRQRRLLWETRDEDTQARLDLHSRIQAAIRVSNIPRR